MPDQLLVHLKSQNWAGSQNPPLIVEAAPGPAPEIKEGSREGLGGYWAWEGRKDEQEDTGVSTVETAPTRVYLGNTATHLYTW